MKVFFEKWTPCLISIGVMVFCFLFYPQRINFGELIKNFPAIGTFTFGFLLTLFGLIHQGCSIVIESFKKQRNLYKRFVHLNRNSVYVSLALTLYAYLLDNVIDLCEGVTIYNKIAVAIFAGSFVYFMITSIYFLVIFYKLVELDS